MTVQMNPEAQTFPARKAGGWRLEEPSEGKGLASDPGVSPCPVCSWGASRALHALNPCAGKMPSWVTDSQYMSRAPLSKNRSGPECRLISDVLLDRKASITLEEHSQMVTSRGRLPIRKASSYGSGQTCKPTGNNYPTF